MTNPSDNLNGRLKGIGITMSASPPMQDLHREAVAKFEAGATEEEVRNFLAEYMVDHPDLGVRSLLGMNRKVARYPADKALMVLAKLWGAKLKKKSIRDLLVQWTHHNHLDGFFSDFIVGWAQTGEPPALSGNSARVIGDFKFGKDGEPLIFMMAGPLCDPEEAAQAFLKKCALTFPPETLMKKGFSERDAGRFKAFEEGATDFDIAKTELDAEGWQTRAVDKREYNREVKTRANSVLVSRNRWSDYVTGLFGMASPKSD